MKVITQAKCIARLKALIKLEHPEINLANFEIPLTNGMETPKLKDILETGPVDEKYYLKSDTVQKIVEEAGFQERLVSFKLPKA